MKYYGKAEQVANSILSAFESGDIPSKLQTVFIRRNDDIPCRYWSWNNQLLTAFKNTNDARGFRQWQDVGRKVKKGAKAFFILGPCKAKKIVIDPETGKEKDGFFIYGFKSIPVFRIEDTEIFDAEKWEKHSKPDSDNQQFIQSLPFVDVANKWGLKVETFNGKNKNYLGFYVRGQQLAIGTKNLATWAHELVHAADDKNNNLVTGFGQIKSNEIVAEFGGAILLKLINQDYEADLGGAWEYIQSYSNHDKNKAIKLCLNLLDRTCNAVSKILDTAENIKAKAA